MKKALKCTVSNDSGLCESTSSKIKGRLIKLLLAATMCNAEGLSKIK